MKKTTPNGSSGGFSRREFMKTLTAGGTGIALLGGCATDRAGRRDAGFTSRRFTA